jgi:hypothetical protein
MADNFASQQPYRYTNLHKRDRAIAADIPSVAALSSTRLLDALSDIHVDYCNIQRKPHAIYIQGFKKPELGSRIPTLSANYGQGRWGLFGYRFDASYILYRSRKYHPSGLAK